MFPSLAELTPVSLIKLFFLARICRTLVPKMFFLPACPTLTITLLSFSSGTGFPFPSPSLSFLCIFISVTWKFLSKGLKPFFRLTSVQAPLLSPPLFLKLFSCTIFTVFVRSTATFKKETFSSCNVRLIKPWEQQRIVHIQFPSKLQHCIRGTPAETDALSPFPVTQTLLHVFAFDR